MTVRTKHAATGATNFDEFIAMLEFHQKQLKEWRESGVKMEELML
jgi:hypothetical protein